MMAARIESGMIAHATNLYSAARPRTHVRCSAAAALLANGSLGHSANRANFVHKCHHD